MRVEYNTTVERDDRPASAAMREIPHAKRSTYMDANATTPLLPAVFEAMTPWLLDRCGNASSGHAHGREARAAVETARQQVAKLLNCSGMEVIFTSGGTEADNLAIFGVVGEPGGHIITSSIEHYAVLHVVGKLERAGCATTYLPVDECALVNPENVRRALRPNTRLISIMMANETGAIQPVEEIGRIARSTGFSFIPMQFQAAGKIPIDVERIGCDLLSISGHKMHGPQGTGALFVRRSVKFEPMFYGGAHELGRRAGTENVAGIVGFGQAALIAREGFHDGSLDKLARLRNDLERGVLLESGNAGINGPRTGRVPNTTNIWFGGGIDGASLLMMLDELGLSVSGGSACCTGMAHSSHVLLAMGLSPERASASIRFSLSKQSTGEDVDYAIWQVLEAIEQLRKTSLGTSTDKARKRKAPAKGTRLS